MPTKISDNMSASITIQAPVRLVVLRLGLRNGIPLTETNNVASDLTLISVVHRELTTAENTYSEEKLAIHMSITSPSSREIACSF